MNALSLVAFLCSVAFSLSSQAAVSQGPSHTAEVDLELKLVDSRGKVDHLAEESTRFSLIWDTGKCQIGVKGHYAYCDLNLSQDLKSRSGQLLVSSMPVAHFSAATINSLMVLLGQNSGSLRTSIEKAVSETASERASGFDLPFYTCETCEPSAKSAGKTPVWNAYDGFVTTSIEINHPALAGKKLQLIFSVHNMKAYGGAFHVVGNNDAGNFGAH